MNTIKYYIAEYYIKNSFLSFAGLVLIAGIMGLIFDYMPENYTYWSISLAILTSILGAILIGYYNATSAARHQGVTPTYLHLFLVIGLFITNSIWGPSSFLIDFSRELLYFVFLQFGVYLYTKKNHHK